VQDLDYRSRKFCRKKTKNLRDLITDYPEYLKPASLSSERRTHRQTKNMFSLAKKRKKKKDVK